MYDDFMKLKNYLSNEVKISPQLKQLLTKVEKHVMVERLHVATQCNIQTVCFNDLSDEEELSYNSDVRPFDASQSS